MRFKTHWSCDTPFCFVDIYLETPAECAFTDADIWNWLTPQLAGVCHPNDVIDFDLHVKNAAGQWVDVYRNEEGQLVTPSWNK